MHLTDWRRNILVYKLDSFIDWFFIPIGIWVLFYRQFLTFTEITSVFGLALLWATLLELPSGALADLIGRKRTVIIGRVCYFLSHLTLIFAHNFWGFLLGQLLYQTNSAFESGAQSALLFDSLKENGQADTLYKKVETDTFFSNTIGMVVASIAGGFLYNFHFRLPYIVAAVVALIGIGISFFYEEPHLDSEKFTFKNYIKQNIDGTKHIFENPTIRAFSLFSILVNLVALSGLWYLYEPRLAAGGFDPRLLAFLVSGTYLTRALGTKLIPHLDKKLKVHEIPLFIAVLQTVGSAFSFIHNQAGAILSVYTRKFSDGFRYPILAALQNKEIDSKYRATSLSAISLFTNLLLAIGGIFIGRSIDAFGIANTLGFFTIIGIVFVLPSASHLSQIIKTQSKVV